MRSPETARRPGDVRAAPGKEEPSMESAAGVEPAGLSHWTTSGKEGDGSHRQEAFKAIEESIKRQREVKFVFGNREVGC